MGATSSEALATNNPLLDLANLVLSTWNSWLSGLSDEVNKHGGMYPHSMVVVWADGLDELASWTARDRVGRPGSGPAGQFASRPHSNEHGTNHPLVTSFQSAVLPMRNRFVAELGWLAGRNIPQSIATPVTQNYRLGDRGAWNGSDRMIVTGSAEEEL